MFGRCFSKIMIIILSVYLLIFILVHFYLDFLHLRLNIPFIQVLQYLLDDVSEFLSTKFIEIRGEKEMSEDKGCIFVLKSFIDYLFEREKENFRARRKDNDNSVTLTTIHQVSIPLG